MILLSWNSRGLGNPRRVRVLADLVREEDTKVLFLQETKLHARAAEKLKFRLGFENCLAVSSEGRSGGLALYWKKQVKVVIKNYSKSHIHASIHDAIEEGETWFLTGIYGQPEAHRRHETWDLIRSLKLPQDQGWLLIGDFNEVLSNHEKSGGRESSDRQMQAFQAVVDECELMDLGFQGNPFTWCNNRETDQCISERLDRCLASLKWKAFFPMAKVIHGTTTYSDHTPIKSHVHFASVQRRGKRPFRFEAMWVEDSSCQEVIKEAWLDSAGERRMEGVMKQISRCGEKSERWNKNSFGHVQKNLKKAKQKLQNVQDADPKSLNSEAIKNARS
ncbi:uncharacterized protein LOC121235397 [Juglans microcarpa x Juglans regia]|uniref:uncharacterized protein LOC121235397 n=1 Tax=Juglans microcarpa x Juglans regia TaxID=2249226 RepID=UPI001B7F46BA|nr:uncharacterized protein LOC121235397 [Juglans microcarpa x Juglans regia]